MPDAIKNMRKAIKKERKGLTNDEEYGILTKLSERTTSSVEGLKKLKKVLQNPLTKRQQSDIINKLSTERPRQSLIEN